MRDIFAQYKCICIIIKKSVFLFISLVMYAFRWSILHKFKFDVSVAGLHGKLRQCENIEGDLRELFIHHSLEFINRSEGDLTSVLTSLTTTLTSTEETGHDIYVLVVQDLLSKQPNKCNALRQLVIYGQ